jgi:hypothetical protein
VPVPVPLDPSGAVLPSGLGQVQFEGVAYSHKDVAALLNALATQKGFDSAYFTESRVKEGDAVGRPLVTFKAQVTLTDTILSRRFAKGAP